VAARNKGTHFVVTANRLRDGRSVYLRPDDTWAESIDEAKVLEHESEQEACLALARSQEGTVCDPYVFSVRLEHGKPVLLTQREVIRNSGPTVYFRRLGHGQQVVKEA